MKKPTNQRPGKASSLSGRPKAFSHVKGIRPEFQMAATGLREKAKLKARAPELRKAFRKAHEGPREKLGKPRLHNIYTPNGKTVAAVHSKIDAAKAARNRQKDLQMKKWRERKVPQPTRTDRPKHSLKKTAPEVFAKAGKQRSVKELIQQKQARSRGRGGRRR